MPNYLLQKLTSSEFSMLHSWQNRKCTRKKKRKKENRHNGTQILETDFHLYFQLQGNELQRERERDTFEFISFSFGIYRV